jgi:hypothetical protein
LLTMFTQNSNKTIIKILTHGQDQKNDPLRIELLFALIKW